MSGNGTASIPSIETSRTFTLTIPVDWNGQKITSLKIRRPKVKDTRLLLSDMDTDPIGGQSKYFASLAGQPAMVIEELDLADMKMIREWVESFTQDVEKK